MGMDGCAPGTRGVYRGLPLSPSFSAPPLALWAWHGMAFMWLIANGSLSLSSSAWLVSLWCFRGFFSSCVHGMGVWWVVGIHSCRWMAWPWLWSHGYLDGTMENWEMGMGMGTDRGGIEERHEVISLAIPLAVCLSLVHMNMLVGSLKKPGDGDFALPYQNTDAASS
ncbi:hypothetical protein B0T18DRAFT_205941 [Schizothecium vesticola]|uniref:Uncharacterized protein n=1 Tax=Schizothecium vesticola TaxID=314040 RepID=A0AA40EJ44_9PEZI|nr:hypothetical protein B0T18DRAFT_205941 [Schizothecium vesticola]